MKALLPKRAQTARLPAVFANSSTTAVPSLLWQEAVFAGEYVASCCRGAWVCRYWYDGKVGLASFPRDGLVLGRGNATEW